MPKTSKPRLKAVRNHWIDPRAVVAVAPAALQGVDVHLKGGATLNLPQRQGESQGVAVERVGYVLLAAIKELAE